MTLSIASRDEVTRRASAAFAGKSQSAHYNFATLDLLWQTRTRKRWDLIQPMTWIHDHPCGRAPCGS